MYYTCTVNPALDYFLNIPQLEIGSLNRVDNGTFQLGGKGIIVSRILNILGAKTTATGFIGGFTGHYIEQTLKGVGIETTFIPIETATRVNVILFGNVETDINTAGPTITATQMKQLLTFISTTLTHTDTFFLCGNKSQGMTKDDYLQIATAVHQSGARLIVDSNTDLLTHTLSTQPFIIKPNHIELGEIIGNSISTTEECILGARQLQSLGAQNVLVSRGGDGAVLVTSDNRAYSVNVAKVTKGKQTIGAGDTMLASFIYALDTFQDIKKALAFASAAGGATVESDDLATLELINHFLPEIEVKEEKQP